MSQIEKLNNETRSKREEFIDIATQIQEINSRTKFEPNTRKKLKSGELGRTEYLSFIFKIEDKKHKRKQELEQHLQKYAKQQQQQRW